MGFLVRFDGDHNGPTVSDAPLIEDISGPDGDDARDLEFPQMILDDVCRGCSAPRRGRGIQGLRMFEICH
jgi:hypothetical protein